MKKLLLISLFLSLFCSVSQAMPTKYNNKYLQPEISQVFIEKHSKPLTDIEKKQLNDFRVKVGEIPPKFFFDLLTRGLGVGKGVPRVLSDDEKKFIKDNLDNLHLLPFLVFLNLADMDLETIPDSIGELPNLGVLKLNKNKFKTVPPAVDMLLDGRMLLLDINENALDPEVNIRYSKKALESLYQNNKLSILPWEKLEWKGQLVESENAQEVEGCESDAETYTLLMELLMLSVLEPFEKEQGEWLDDSENLVRLSKSIKDTSPKEAAEYISANPDKVLPEPMFGMEPAHIKTSLCEMVLNHLCDAGRVGIVGQRRIISADKSDDNQEKSFIKPEAVTGWSRYFTTEPLQDADIWLTAEGVAVLFHMISALKSVYHVELTDEDILAYALFEKKYNVPFMISEDIKLYRSIGLRNLKPRVLTEHEKAWLKTNIKNLGELPFLKFLDLSNLGLYTLPTNFNNFRDIMLLHLTGNKFKKMPEVLATIHGRFQKVAMLLDDNLLAEKEQKRFAKICDKKREEFVRASVVKSNVKVSNLVWSPEFIKLLGLDEVAPCEKLKPMTSQERKAERAKVKAYGNDFLEAWEYMQQEKQKEFQAQEKRYSYYLHAFFELMLRESERKVEAIDAMAKAILDPNQGNQKVIEEKTSEEGEIKVDAWFEEHKALLRCFLGTHTPDEFISLFADDKKFLPRMLKEKKKREEARSAAPELYTTFRDESEGLTAKKLFLRAKAFFTLLITNLQADNKVIPLDMSGKQVTYFGWDSYFTNKPVPGKPHNGWLTRKGIAELLIDLKLVEMKEESE